MELNVEQYAKEHLGSYKMTGQEIKVKVCPFCKDNKKSNQYKFIINAVTGLYKCWRGKCNSTGNLTTLKRHLTPHLLNNREVKKRPLVKPIPLSEKYISWIRGRGISDQVIRDCKIAEADGAMFFPHFDKKGSLITQKFTKPADDGRGRVEWIAGKTSPMSAWGIEKIDHSQPVIITEGEFDRMAVMTAGYYNTISIPAGTSNMYWLGEDYETLSQVKSFIIWMDFDNPGTVSRYKIADFLGYDRCKFIECDYKDANKALIEAGSNYVIEQLKNAKQIHIKRVTYLSEVEDGEPWEKREKLALTRLRPLNEMLGGGLPFPGITILSGYRGSGKTTLIYTIAANAVENDYNVFCYSGETDAPIFKHDFLRTIAGENGIVEYSASDEIKEQFKEKHQKKIIINTTPEAYESNEFLELIENAVRRYNTRVFIVDNLMKIKFSGNHSLSEVLEAQEDFVSKIDVMCRKYGLQVILVQHPKKCNGMKINADDIRGNGRMMDLASNILIVHRINEKFCNLNKVSGLDYAQSDSMITVEKNRGGSDEGDVFFNYSRKTGRFYKDDFELKSTWLDCDIPF